MNRTGDIWPSRRRGSFGLFPVMDPASARFVAWVRHRRVHGCPSPRSHRKLYSVVSANRTRSCNSQAPIYTEICVSLSDRAAIPQMATSILWKLWARSEMDSSSFIAPASPSCMNPLCNQLPTISSKIFGVLYETVGHPHNSKARPPGLANSGTGPGIVVNALAVVTELQPHVSCSAIVARAISIRGKIR
jgi:hypothetical protein